MDELKDNRLSVQSNWQAKNVAALEAAFIRPRVYGDTPSFMELPVAWDADDLKGADAIFVGIPWEGDRILNSTTFATMGERPADPDAILTRSGAYDAPEYIRKYSVHYSVLSSGGLWPEVGPGFRLPDHVKVVDYRDVEVKEWDVEETARRAIDKVSDIVRAGAVPLVIGGDHSIPYMVMKAISDNTQGKTGIVFFDTHYDLTPAGGRLNAGNALGRIFASCQVDPKNLVEIGIRGTQSPAEWAQVAEWIGCTVFTITDVEKVGMHEVIARAIEIASQDTERIYVSLDVDVIDPLHFPAQKYPDAFGLTARQVREALRVLSRETNLAGFDICCIGPAYDHKGTSALIANRFYVEVLIGLALRKRSMTNDK
ncbi:MAG: arginase family protein [Anaerolineae bacterium]|nr:arginase family protein [Anaerolineae bacterium]